MPVKWLFRPGDGIRPSERAKYKRGKDRCFRCHSFLFHTSESHGYTHDWCKKCGYANARLTGKGPDYPEDPDEGVCY